MSAWGDKAFENDSALDWLAVLEAGSVETLRRALTLVANAGPDEHVDVDDGAAAIAAAEIVAAARGQDRSRIPSSAKAWLMRHQRWIRAEDAALAKRAVRRAVGKGSELCALGDNSPSAGAWRANIEVLLTRLGADANTEA